MDELARLVSVERRLLELLLFKLVEGRHLLQAGEARFLTLAADEIERAGRRLREAESRRSALVSDLAGALDVSEDRLGLGVLACSGPGPFRVIFADHRLALLGLLAEIEGVADQNRRLAELGAREVDHLLGKLDEAGNDDSPERMIDLHVARAGYQAVLDVSTELSLRHAAAGASSRARIMPSASVRS